ncbi:acetyltransferase [Burkholderiales bacterium]|nr:acetyltransferase [Burkholderiales bacterium]
MAGGALLRRSDGASRIRIGELEAHGREAARDVGAGARIVLAADVDATTAGSVPFAPCAKPSQPQRADARKLCAHSPMRRRGFGRALMTAAAARAFEAGRTLLTLDTREASDAVRLHRRGGGLEAGGIPGDAFDPNGATRAGMVFVHTRLARPVERA